ncbi:MAG: hypothetical protein ACRDG4_17480, partial [Chloroflexota bacterium]
MDAGVRSSNFAMSANYRLDVQALLNHAGKCSLWMALFCATLNGGWLARLPPHGQAGLHIYWFDLAVIATLALWACRLVIMPAAALTVGPRVPAAALGGLIGLACIGVPFAADSAVALGMAGRLWLLGLLYLYIVNCRPPATLAVGALGCSLLVQAAVALVQTVRQGSVGLG